MIAVLTKPEHQIFNVFTGCGTTSNSHAQNTTKSTRDGPGIWQEDSKYRPCVE